LADRLHPALVVLEDFVRALALAAHRFGPARGKAHVLYAYLGDSIGSALIIDGQLYRGETDIMGEIGHISVDRSGPPCRCGNNGCLEMLASTPAVLRRVEQRLRHATVESMLRGPVEAHTLTLSTLLQAAQAGDKLAYQVLDETGAMIGRVLATAVNLFGPGQVVLGGPLAQSGGILLEAALRQIRLEALQYISRQVQLVCDDSDALAGARGAAIRALDTLFASDERLQALLARRHRSA
ncbi:MAG: ROK family protein, partial [Anaerolineae bacterium]